ncbi:15134_t:CDS:1, partial [Dentiscutata erythropus]
KGKEPIQPTGKYPPASALNDLIMKASKVTLQGQNEMSSSNAHPVTAPTNQQEN